MRDTHYIICGNTMETADRRLRNGCRAYHEWAFRFNTYDLSVLFQFFLVVKLK